MAREWNGSTGTRSGSPECVRLKAKAIPGADDRQGRIAGFDQATLSRSRVVCIGAGGLGSHIAPTLARKGVGELVLLDGDDVEATNLNRQRFYPSDIGRNKAIALARHVQRECIAATVITGYPLLLEQAIGLGVDLRCDVAVCGVDNNPARVLASREFGRLGIPVIFTAVSADADHGYVFVQEPTGPCFGCMFPDAVDSDTYPCPGTPAIADILQLVGAITVYAIDSCLMKRPRTWNYREVFLSDGAWDRSLRLQPRDGCRACSDTSAPRNEDRTAPVVRQRGRTRQ